MYPSRTYHLFILDIPSVGAEHIIRKPGAFHPKHPDFSSKTSELFVKTTGIFQANACHSACWSGGL